MKSRGATYLLLAVVAVVWGAVAWKILAPVHDTGPIVRPKAPTSVPETASSDTLRLDYPDPFLKGTMRQAPRHRSAVRTLPAAKTVPRRRERVEITHLGTVASAGHKLHILTIGGEQYELARGESAGDFVLSASDRDSLYLLKNGVTYGVKLCD